ncbi:MAG: ABC transporter permease subunit [Candidatus Microthrix sp.]|nr:ABC transporter permease subunit [Candidatus Microthrix sp.]
MISVAILAVLVIRSAGFLTQVEWSSLVSSLGWFPRSNRYDLVTLLLGSLWVTGIALAVATPVGVGAAVYLSEYASKRVRRWLKPSVEILAGLPSVVVAFFILQVIYPTALEGVLDSKYTLFAAGIGVGILTIPIVASVTEDALSAVPNSLREASVGLGARKAVTTVRVVLPAAVSGITAALIVGASRALGETMLVTLVAGGANGSARAFGPGSAGGGVTMTSAMANLAAGSDSVAVSSGVTLNPVNSLYVVGLVLFMFTLGLNLIGDRLVRRFRQSY